MFKDQGPHYTLGFGIPQSKNPIQSDHNGNIQEGINPNGGIVARALYNHPIAKFFTVSAATMIGAAVGEHLIRRGAVRLGEKLGEKELPFLSREFRNNLGHQFRQTQQLFDEWEGADSRLGADAANPIKRSSFFQNYEHRKYLQDNGLEDDGDRWLLRDEMQQRFIRNARNLPYQLPALYVANRAANTLVGNQNTPVDWKNPFDVIGDFAQTSTHALAVNLAPFEVGQGALKQGWRRMMTDGDFVSNTSTFSPHLKQFGVGLKTLLNQIGQDSVSLIHETTRRSGQVAGSFANAINEADRSRQPIGIDLLNHDPAHTKFRVKRIKLIADAYHVNGMMGRDGNKGAIEQAIPTLTGFVRGFGQSWVEHEENFKNLEAARKGENSYLWRGQSKKVDLNRIRTSSYITQLDTSLNVAKTKYIDDQKNIAYKNILQTELAQRIASGQGVGGSAQSASMRFIRGIEVDQPVRKMEGDTSPRTEMISRVKFGIDPIYDTREDPWETEFQRRIGALGVTEHGNRIIAALPQALQAADRQFLNPDYKSQLNATIERNFEDIRQNVIIPEARRQLGESKLSYGQYGPNITRQAHELLVRKTAEHLGIPLYDNGITHSTSTLRENLHDLGVQTQTPHQMRAILLDRGAMSHPWAKDGFNFLGLRPLTVHAANAQNYFGSRADSVNHLFEEMNKLDYPYSKGLINRPVGSHVWESRTGKIIDLNPTMQGIGQIGQIISRHLEVPFMHFSPLDLTSFNKFSDLAQGPAIHITPASNINFGAVNRELSPEGYDSHVWIRNSSGMRGRGQVFGYHPGSETRKASGLYYAPNTMGNGTWEHNLRIALGNKGIYDPDAGQPNISNRLRRFFRVDSEQPNSVFNLIHRVYKGEFGERYLGKEPDVENPAVLARLIQDGKVPDLKDFDTKWARGARNLEKAANQSQLPPTVLNGINEINPELGRKLKVYDRSGKLIDISSVKNAHDLFDITHNLFSADLDQASALIDQGKIDQSIRGSLKATQGYIQKTYLENSTAESLNNPAARSVSTAGINTRMDEMKASIYRYLVARESLLNESNPLIIQDLLNSVDTLSQQGKISAGQKTEARAAILSMQINIDSIKFGFGDKVAQSQEVLRRLGRGHAADILTDFANYDPSLLHHNRYFGAEAKISRFLLQRFGVSKQITKGIRYNPYGGGQDTTFVPTFETSLFNNPIRALKSAAGFSTWNDPEAFSALGIRTSHLATRLNRYFHMGGIGVDETQYKGPMGFLNRGLVGRRILPLAVGSAAFMAVDRTLGGLVHGKDQYGNRQYTPLISGAIATGVAHAIVLGAGITGGADAYREKKAQYFGDEDVPIRKGRYWPMGNQPWRGGRVQYYRPNWYRRFMSGYQYTDQTYGSPAERLAFDYDFSPLHYIDPYHFERQHYQDRPYPVTGDLFTGPWGPLTPELNATIGRVLKPHKLMHKQEFNQAMHDQYRRVGDYGMIQIGSAPPSSGYGTSGYGSPNINRSVHFASGDADHLYAGGNRISLKEAKGSQSPRGIATTKSNNFDSRIIPASNPINPGHIAYQSGQYGYQTQEMAGIYGFALGSGRQLYGLGSPNYTPNKPVLQQASKAYGSERSFWDLNLGGLGDFPTPLRGEYGNIEFSEIARRFVPHDRNDVNELNPLPNQMSQKYPWLPGPDYFVNYDQGDPYTKIAGGEMLLPGKGYERLHQLHPDTTGQYGLLDKQRILGNIAPWSQEYREASRAVSQMHLSPEQRQFVLTTKEQVANIKQRHDFKPYQYAHSNFQSKDVKVVGFYPGEADQLITNAGVVQLAGIRTKNGPGALKLAQSLIHKGDTVHIQYNVNAPTPYGSPLDAVVRTRNGTNVGSALLNANLATQDNQDMALMNRTSQSHTSFYLHSLIERAKHANTIINQKFVPDRTATEDWERYHVYGTDFPEWTHPITDFIEPLGQRARNRNPIYAGTVLSFVGRAFGRTPQGKTAGSFIGAGTGLYLSMTSNAKTFETGSRYLPQRREHQLGLEEYTDVLKYIKYSRLYNIERQEAIDQENSDPDKYLAKQANSQFRKGQFSDLGPHTLAALEFRKKMKQTEYGADLFGNPMDEVAAMPKRKRDYFMPFLNSPKNEHARILSTAPRLERRMYEARWGMAIENKPDLTDYFSQHELPGPDWTGWSPNTNLDNVQIKMIQQQGLEASQMGYYPQQVQEANLLNPAYPDYNQTQSQQDAYHKLQTLLGNAGISSNITMRRTSEPGTSIQLHMGVQNG